MATSIFKQIIEAPSKLVNSSPKKRRKTTRKPTKAQMKKFVYPMLKKAKKTAYANGRKSVKRVVVRRQMY